MSVTGSSVSVSSSIVRNRIATLEAQKDEAAVFSARSPCNTSTHTTNTRTESLSNLVSPQSSIMSSTFSEAKQPAKVSSPLTTKSLQTRQTRIARLQKNTLRTKQNAPLQINGNNPQQQQQQRNNATSVTSAHTTTNNNINNSNSNSTIIKRHLDARRLMGVPEQYQRPESPLTKPPGAPPGASLFSHRKPTMELPSTPMQQHHQTLTETRASRLHKLQRVQQQTRRRSPVMYHQSSSTTTTTNDDDITLTSVRQIVKSQVDTVGNDEKHDTTVLLQCHSTTSTSSAGGGGATGDHPHALQDEETPHELFPNDDDDNTYDYSGRDNTNTATTLYSVHKNQDDHDDHNSQNSQHSVSYAQRQARQRQREQVRLAAATKARASIVDSFVSREDYEYYKTKMDTPEMKTGVGVAAAAAAGCFLLGPVGLLVGAAAVGIGVGVMQIPEEQRRNMQEKASEALRGAHESAMNASEAVSMSCAKSYRESGMDEHVPLEMKTCCTAIDEEVTSGQDYGDGEILVAGDDKEKRAEALGNKGSDGKTNLSPKFRNKKDKVACLREGQIIAVGQIHSLEPSAQPGAWLDVLASAETSHDEKMEAMEEVLILAKDKQRARIFLEEGILDSIMWTIRRYIEKLGYDPEKHNWSEPNITKKEISAAKLAASCCLTLGKSHCAAVHTGGDLLLMSLYERGTVPEERQLAQMLHEVPYHSRITKTDDPTRVDPPNEVFAMQQLTLPQAEELAKTIAAVAAGQVQ